jgi:hypothetical protein
MIYEIRDYHYRPDIFEAYLAWAKEAVPVLRSKMDVVGFWIDAGTPPEITGTHPVDSPIGSANVTWIIRWDSKEARDAGLGAAIGSDEWKAVWSRHPDPNGYLQMSARFMTAM